MQYFLKSEGLWDHTLSSQKNLKLVAIVFKGEALNNNAKLERQEKYMDKIIAWTKNNNKCKGYIGYMYLSHIQ